MKKILLLLLFSIFINSFPSIAFAVDQKKQEQLLVEAITDIRLDTDGRELTRGEFCKIVYEVSGGEAPEATGIAFADVGLDHQYAGYIQNVYERGIISGNGDGNFLPEDKIKLCEAYTMLLKMGGYNDLLSGVYPDTSLKLAAEIGLTKGIYKTWNDTVDSGDVYTLIYNLIFSKTLVKTGLDVSSSGQEYLTEVLKIYEGKGIIEVVDGYSLHGELVREEVAKISGMSFVNDGVVSFDEIGLSGKYYYKETENSYEDYELIAFLPKNNEKMELFSGDIKAYSNNVYKYADGNRYKEVDLEAQKDVMYNNEQARSEAVMIPRYGYVTLIDNNNNGKYDVVIINDYQNIYPTYVNTTDKVVVYYDSTDGYTKKKELVIGDRECVVIDEEGRRLTINAIKKNSILTVLESSEEVYIYQCSEKVKGKITGIDTEYIAIDDEKIKRSKDIYTDSWNGTSYIEVEVYLDKFGNIGAVVPTEDNTWQYGYVIKTGFSAEEDTAWLRILCEDNTKKKIWINGEKIRVDGTKVAIADKNDVDNQIGYECLIRYRLDREGRINAVDKERTMSSFDLQEANLANDDCLLKRHDGQTVYKSATKMFKMYATTAQNTTLKGEAYHDEETIIFNVPKTVTAQTTEDEYSVVNALMNDLICRTVSYNIEPSSMASDVVVCYAPPQKSLLDSGARCMAVKKISSAYHEDELTYLVTGLYNGSEIQKYVDKKIADVFVTAEEGDYFRVTVDGEYITAAELIYSKNGGGFLNRSYYYGGNDANAEMRYLMGKVVEHEGDRMLVKYTTPQGDKTEIFRADSFVVYVYDRNRMKGECVYSGTASDIKDINGSGTGADTVILSTRVTLSRDLYIIKN